MCGMSVKKLLGSQVFTKEETLFYIYHDSILYQERQKYLYNFFYP